MKRLFFSLLLVLFLLFVINTPVEARQGCCSRHGGVCGCGCCDGSPLSDTCAPYYPECSGGGQIEEEKEVYIPPTVIPTRVPTKKPAVKKKVVKPTAKPTRKPTKKPVQKKVKKPTPTITKTIRN